MVIDMRIDSHSHIFSWDGVNYDYEQYPSLLEYQNILGMALLREAMRSRNS